MNNFRKDFRLGVSTWFRSWKFIFDNNLFHFFLYPIIISILLGMGVIALIGEAVDVLKEMISSYFVFKALPDASWWDKALEFFSDISGYAISFALWLIFLYIYQRIHKYIVLAIMSPMMSILSEKTEEILTGKKIPFDGQQFVRDVARGVAISLRNMLIELSIGILLWMVGLVLTFFTGGIGMILMPFVLLISISISSYFYGFSTMDYTNERRRRGIRESIRFIRNRKGLAMGNGSIFYLWMKIPWIGVTIATVTCTVAATLAMHELEKSKPQ